MTFICSIKFHFSFLNCWIDFISLTYNTLPNYESCLFYCKTRLFLLLTMLHTDARGGWGATKSQFFSTCVSTIARHNSHLSVQNFLSLIPTFTWKCSADWINKPWMLALLHQFHPLDLLSRPLPHRILNPCPWFTDLTRYLLIWSLYHRRITR